MRHLSVLLLVILALAALAFALFTGDDAPRTDPGGASAPTLDAPAGPERERGTETLAGAGTRSEAEPQSTSVVREGVQLAPEQQARLDFGCALAGTVVDREANPVEGARVRVERGSMPDGLGLLQQLTQSEPKPADEIWNAVTGPDGTYRIDGLEPGGDYGITVRGADFAPAARQMVVLRPEAVTVEDFRLKSGIRLFGVVRDENGTPIPEAELLLTTLIGAQLMLARGESDAIVQVADDQGRYSFENLEKGPRAMIVRAKGYGSLNANDLQIKGDVEEIERNFELEPGTFIAGRVLSPAKNPIPGALVRAISYDSETVSQGSAESDERGNFRVESLAEGTYSLIATADGWGSARLNRIEGGQDDVVLEMIEQGTVRGTVIDSRSREPLAAFKVFARQVIPNSPVYNRRVGVVSTDGPAGSFEIRGLDEGTYVVEALADGYAPTYSESFQVTLGMVTADIVVPVSQGGEIAGIVLDPDGKPLRGARVVTHDNTFVRHQLMDLLGRNAPRNTADRSVVTGEDGRFLLTLLTPELYQVEITHPKYTTLVKKDLRVFPDGQRTDMGELRMQAGGSIAGVVIDGNGQPLPNATVNLTTTEAGRMDNYQARTGAKGQYRIDNILPGAYRLHAAGPTDPQNPFGSVLDMTNSQVDISVYDGQEIVKDLNL